MQPARTNRTTKAMELHMRAGLLDSTPWHDDAMTHSLLWDRVIAPVRRDLHDQISEICHGSRRHLSGEWPSPLEGPGRGFGPGDAADACAALIFCQLK